MSEKNRLDENFRQRGVATSMAGKALSQADSKRRIEKLAGGHVDYYLLAANRLGYGNSTALQVEWAKMPGNSPELIFDQYVEQQLSPDAPPAGIPAVDDSYFNSIYGSAGFQTLGLSISQLWDRLHENPNAYGASRRDGIEEVEWATFMRACYSRKRLHEVLADFWHNHFSCHGWDYWSQAVWPHFDLVMRNNMLGNFRTMLGIVSQHPAMLYYLDQYTSTDSGPNENFARELFELHTLGSENYFGVVSQNAVPTDGQGVPVGYVDNDVFEAARCLTGWTVNNGSGSSNNGQDDGSFFFNLSTHDRGLKRVLGLEMPAGTRGVQDGVDVIDALAFHPGTAKHIARKLCVRFISDDPPQSIIDAAAATFYNNRYASNQLALVMRTILKSNEFKSTFGEKLKRPFEVAAGAIASTSTIYEFQRNGDDTNSLLWRYDSTGQSLFNWRSPDGFPDTAAKWSGASTRVALWRMILWMSDDRRSNNGPYHMDVVSQTPAGFRTAQQVADYWIQRILARPMTTADRQEVVDFLADGSSETLPMNFNDSATQARVRTALALIINSPYFLER